MRGASIWLCAAWVAAAGAAASGDVTIRKVDYHGWKGAYRLANGTVEVVVVPQIGRILRYGFVGGPNALWENPALRGRVVADPAHAPRDWTNFGGDKLWPAPQAKWGWPPDPYIDPAPQKVAILPGGRLQMTGQTSRKHGVRFRREIALAPTGTGVTLRNVMENTTDQDVEWSVWEVAQVASPDVALLPIHRAGHFSRGYYVFKDSAPQSGMLTVQNGQVRVRRHPGKASKIGADSPQGWAAMRRGGLRFTIRAAYEAGQTYPDDGCAQEIYTNPDPLPYVELEMLGPIRFLQPGDSTLFVTRWSLERAGR